MPIFTTTNSKYDEMLSHEDWLPPHQDFLVGHFFVHKKEQCSANQQRIPQRTKEAQMVVISDQLQAAQITHPSIHAFVSTRLQQLNSPAAANEAQLPCIATFIVVEPGDCISSIEKTVGFRILESLLDCIPFGHPDYSPPFEIMEHQRPVLKRGWLFCFPIKA